MKHQQPAIVVALWAWRQQILGQHCHHLKGSVAAKKFKTALSAGKVMLTAFWNINSVVHLEFMLIGSPINYMSTLLEHCKIEGTYSETFSSRVACFSPTHQCEASCMCMNACRDSLPCFHYLGSPTILLRLGLICLPSFPETKVTSERTSLVRLWSHDSFEDDVPSPKHAILSWQTHETFWRLVEVCQPQRWSCWELIM
jgi:hypothetical protein